MSLKLREQRSHPGKTIVVDGKQFISCGQVLWMVAEDKVCLVDLVFEDRPLAGVAELRDIKAVIRVADTEMAPKPLAAVPTKPNRETKRKVAKTKKKH